MNPPPQQPERRRGGDPPPHLSDDVLAEIFFRIPADDPAVLVRLSAICKSWRRLLTKPDFLRRYHALHRAPPILGFFCEEKAWSGSFSSFVRTTSFRPIIPDRGGDDWLPCDSRHGRALFNTQQPLQLLVLDPITGMERPLCAPQLWTNIQWSAAVLCAVDCCGHHDCHGRAFRVALVGTDDARGTTHAAVYSSETYEWSDPTSIDHHPNARVQARRPSVLVGNALYFLCRNNTRIMEFDMATMTLSVIPSPPLAEDVYGALLVTAEGGGLGFAAILKQSRRLHQWSKEEATNQWKHLEHVRNLKKLLPYTEDVYVRDAISPISNLLIGFADGAVRVVVVRTHDGVFTVELGSTRRPKKVSRRSAITAAFPYTSFCTPDHS